MKRTTLKQALRRLKDLKQGFQRYIAENYEQRAKDCLTCETQGACCRDAHFVNVHITRLEAEAVRRTLDRLPAEKRAEIYARSRETVRRYGLGADGDTFSRTYACPLFEPGTGCLVHREAKPLPCIAHACYERERDQPPGHLQADREKRVERLNTAVWGNAWNWLPLPVWLDEPDADEGS